MDPLATASEVFAEYESQTTPWNLRKFVLAVGDFNQKRDTFI